MIVIWAGIKIPDKGFMSGLYGILITELLAFDNGLGYGSYG